MSEYIHFMIKQVILSRIRISRNNGATIRRVDRFTIAAIFHYNEPKGSNWQLPILPARLHASTFGL